MDGLIKCPYKVLQRGEVVFSEEEDVPEELESGGEVSQGDGDLGHGEVDVRLHQLALHEAPLTRVGPQDLDHTLNAQVVHLSQGLQTKGRGGRGAGHWSEGIRL